MIGVAEDEDVVLENEKGGDEGLLSLFRDGLLFDVWINVASPDGKEARVGAHRVVLAAASPVLRKLVTTEEFAESKGEKGELWLGQIDSEALGWVLEFLYGGCVRLRGAMAVLKLYQAGDLLDVETLRQACMGQAAVWVSCGTCLEMMQTASRMGLGELTNLCETYIADNFEAVAVMQSPHKMDAWCMERLLGSSSLSVHKEEYVVCFWATSCGGIWARLASEVGNAIGLNVPQKGGGLEPDGAKVSLMRLLKLGELSPETLALIRSWCGEESVKETDGTKELMALVHAAELQRTSTHATSARSISPEPDDQLSDDPKRRKVHDACQEGGDVGTCTRREKRLVSPEATLACCREAHGILCCGDMGGNVVLYDLESMQVKRSLGTAGNSVMSLAICERSGQILAGDDSANIFVWGLGGGLNEHIVVCLQEAGANDEETDMVQSMVIDEANMVLACGGDQKGGVTLLDIGTWTVVARLEGPTCEVRSLCMLNAFARSGRVLLASGSADGDVHVYDCAAQGGSAESTCAEVAGDGVARRGGVRSAGSRWRMSSCHVLQGHSDSVDGLAACPAMQLLASAGVDKCVYLWSTANWTCVFTIDCKSPVNGLVFSSVRLVSVSEDGVVSVANLANCLYGSQEHQDCFRELADDELAIADVPAAGHSGEAFAVAVCGSKLFSGGEDRAVKVWQ